MRVRNYSRRLGYWGLGWFGLAVAAAIWQLVSHLEGTILIPGFAPSLTRAWDLVTGPVLTEDLVPSIERTLLGFAISAVVGVVVGMLVGQVRALREWTSALFDFLRSLPTPLLIPVAIVLFGLSGTMVVAVIVTAAVWPVLINTSNATANLEPVLLDTAQVLKLRGPKLLLRVILPAVSPEIFAGMRTAISISLAVMVVAEILGASSGIGYFIANAQSSFAVTDAYAGVMVLCLVGWLLDTLFLWAERRVLKWQQVR
jgi:ABC-type nitrate/sulfonate/bicarbonate transport system permease component